MLRRKSILHTLKSSNKLIDSQWDILSRTTNLSKRSPIISTVDAEKFSFDDDDRFVAFARNSGIIELWDIRSLPVALTFLHVPEIRSLHTLEVPGSNNDDKAPLSPIPSSFSSTSPCAIWKINASQNICQGICWSPGSTHLCAVFGSNPLQNGEIIQNDNRQWYLLTWEISSQSIESAWRLPFAPNSINFISMQQVEESNNQTIPKYIVLGSSEYGNNFVINISTGSIMDLNSKYSNSNSFSMNLEMISNIVGFNNGSNSENLVDHHPVCIGGIIAVNENKINFISSIDLNNPSSIMLEWNQKMSHRYGSTATPASIVLKTPDSKSIVGNDSIKNVLIIIANDLKGFANELLVIQTIYKPINNINSWDNIEFNVINRQNLKDFQGPVVSMSISQDFSQLILSSSNPSSLRVLSLLDFTTIDLNNSNQNDNSNNIENSVCIDVGFISCDDYDYGNNLNVRTIFMATKNDQYSLLSEESQYSSLRLWQQNIDQNDINLPNIYNRLDNYILPSLFNCMKMAINSQKIFAMGIDKQCTVWTLQRKLKSDFSGPMYPPGFLVMQKCHPHLEAEDELDIIVLNKKDDLGNLVEPIFVDNSSEITLNGFNLELKLNDPLLKNISNKSSNNYLHSLPQSIDNLKSSYSSLLNLRKSKYIVVSSTTDSKNELNDLIKTDNSISTMITGDGVGGVNKNAPLSLPFNSFLCPPRRVVSGDLFQRRKRDYDQTAYEISILRQNESNLDAKMEYVHVSLNYILFL
jgi:hypothetical protein